MYIYISVYIYICIYIYIYIYIYAHLASVGCRIWGLCMSWFIYNHLYMYYMYIHI